MLSGVGIASFLVHGLSVTIGRFIGLTLPDRPIAFAVALGVTAAAALATATAAAVAYVHSRREHPLELPPLESSPDPGGSPAGYCRSND